MKVRKPVFVLFMLVCVVCSLLFSALPVSAEMTSPRYFTTDYADYLRYVQQDASYLHADNYVPFDYFRILGDFRSAQFKYYIGRGYIDYGFTDENGCELHLWIQPSNRIYIANDNYILFPGQMEDMTKLGVKKSGSLVRGPLEYVYEDGLLTCIVWKNGSAEYALSNGSVLYNYPLTGEATITQRLLSKDRSVALSALRELNANTPGILKPRMEFFTRVVYYSSLFVVPISVITTLIVRKRRLKRWVREINAAPNIA